MHKILNRLAGAVLGLGLAAGAQAAPITTDPGTLSANGNVTAVFAFADAGDSSNLLEAAFAGVIFNNQTDAVGAAKNLGNYSGLISFTLSNLSQGYSFTTGVADTGPGGDGFYHAFYSSNFADFGVGALPGATAATIAGLSGSVLFVGFEDRRGGDYDYNDLIFAFTATRTDVPEPASLALFGMGLLGLGLARRRKQA